MNCDIEHWKSFEVNKDDSAYCDILQELCVLELYRPSLLPQQ